jgi:hypothetical protein
MAGVRSEFTREYMMKRTKLLAGLFFPLVALTACTTTGIGGGQLSGAGVSDEAVRFNWKSTDGGITGSMQAVLPDQTFAGRFFQITQQTRADMLNPLWTHWRAGWYDWPYWGGYAGVAYPTTQFITHYSGKVVATLEAPDQQRMRCRFHLVEPAHGMAGGGEGECQLSAGRLVRATFPGK